MNLKENVIVEFLPVGCCAINMWELASQWDEHCSLSKWHDEYTLCQYNPGAENFTKTSFKCKVYKEDAELIIKMLKLTEYKSETFRHGSTFR